MKQVKRINESQLKAIITKTVKDVLNEATIGRGTTTTHSSSSYGDEYGGLTSHYHSTSENPYGSDAVLMLAKRFEDRLGFDYHVESHYNLSDYEKEDPEAENGYKTVPNNGNQAEFVVSSYVLGEPDNFDSVLYVMNIAKKMFGDKTSEIRINEYDSISIFVNADEIRKNEPRRDMLPQRPYSYKDSNKNGMPSIAYSNFKKPQAWSETEN